MALIGLRVREIAHASSLWLRNGTDLNIPRLQPCDCETCKERPRNARYRGKQVETMRNDNEPMFGSGKMLHARTLDLSRLGDEGKWLADYLRSRKRQMGWRHKEVAEAIRSLGVSPDNLRSWGAIYLRHKHGLNIQTIMAWKGEGLSMGVNVGTDAAVDELSNIYTDPGDLS